MRILRGPLGSFNAQFPIRGLGHVQGNADCVRHVVQFDQQAASVLLSVRLFLRRAQAAVVLGLNHTDTPATDGR